MKIAAIIAGLLVAIAIGTVLVGLIGWGACVWADREWLGVDDEVHP